VTQSCSRRKRKPNPLVEAENRREESNHEESSIPQSKATYFLRSAKRKGGSQTEGAQKRQKSNNEDPSKSNTESKLSDYNSTDCIVNAAPEEL
jgi:hypothetical protein